MENTKSENNGEENAKESVISDIDTSESTRNNLKRKGNSDDNDKE